MQMIRGSTQIKSLSVDLGRLVANFLNGSDWDITDGANNATIKGLRDATAADEPATKGQLDALEASLVGGLQYKGAFDATTPSPDLAAVASQKGDFYKVSVAGTYLSIELAVGDMIIINKDVAIGAIVAGDIDKIENTEAPDILRESELVDDLLTNDALAPLAASQGVVIKASLDDLYSKVHTKVFGEIKTVTHNVATVNALVNTPVADQVAVYLNGVREFDFTYNSGTKVITFGEALKTGDHVAVDYEYDDE